MLWRFSRPIRTRSKPQGFILPCQPALADRPPSGPGWQHEIKWDGYRVIVRKDGEQVRLWARTTSDYSLWARTTSDYSKAFTRIRDAVAALPADSVVGDGEAICCGRITRPTLTAYARGRAKQRRFWSRRPEPLEERRKRLARLLSRSNKPKKRAAGQREMLLPIAGKGTTKEAAKDKAKEPARPAARQRKAG